MLSLQHVPNCKVLFVEMFFDFIQPFPLLGRLGQNKTVSMSSRSLLNTDGLATACNRGTG